MTRVQKIKELRRRTGCRLWHAKLALTLHDYDLTKAEEQLRTQGTDFTFILLCKVQELEARIKELESK